MKVYGCLKSLLVSEPVSPFLDGLDLGVQRFTHRIGDRMLDVRQNILQMATNQMSDLSHGFEATVGGPSKPALPEGSGFLQGRSLPQGPKLLFHGPSSSDFQVQGPERASKRCF